MSTALKPTEPMTVTELVTWVAPADRHWQLTDGSWSASSTVIDDGDLVLESIGFAVQLATIYRTTRLARG